jgi:hypothetical protein
VPSTIIVAQAAQTNEPLVSASASDSLSVEQMRMAGAAARERQKAQARKATPVLNKGVVTAQNAPGA